MRRAGGGDQVVCVRTCCAVALHRIGFLVTMGSMSDPANWRERIVVDSAILVGKPVVKGTRIAVEFIIDLLARGWSEAQILDNYPGVTGDDIRACLSYAGEILRSDRVYALVV